MYKYYPKNWCWVAGICSWWNPPTDVLIDALSKDINFCVRCFEMDFNKEK